MAGQDKLVQARERYEDACDFMRDNWNRMREDLAFSNPAEPKQWSPEALKIRKGRPCYTFDGTNQFLAQIVNDARKNKPAVMVIPVDSGGDKWTAQVIGGLLRHIEYVSRADQAYDTAIEHAARCGIGWLRVLPEVLDPALNVQEIVIKRIVDPFSVVLDPGHTAADGSDAQHGFVTTRMTHRAFQRQYPKKKLAGWPAEKSELWGDDKTITVCEYFALREEPGTHLRLMLPDGRTVSKPEGEYDAYEKKLGFKPQLVDKYQGVKYRQTWCKMTGAEILEETEFPSRWVPLIPVLGDELWVDGKRYLSGMVRKIMEAQRAYNIERSAAIEYVMMQPKAPFMLPIEAVEGHEDHWAKLNTGNPAFLPYNHLSKESGEPIPPPSRQAPPPMPAAFSALGQIARQDMEAAAGMHKANLGQQGNESSGRAIIARQQEGDTATFHYGDNMTRAITHLGRIIVDMLPNIYDEQRTARIINENGKQDFVQVIPGSGPAQREGAKVLTIDPTAGTYDVRVVAGAMHATQRQEAAMGLENILQAQPGFGPALIPALLKLRDIPDGDKYARAASALAPPEVRAILDGDEEGGEPQIPPQVQAKMEQMDQQMQQMTQMLDAAEKHIAELESKEQQAQAKLAQDAQFKELDAQLAAKKISIDEFNAETARLKLQVEAEAKMREQTSQHELAAGEQQREAEGEQAEQSAMQAIADAVTVAVQQGQETNAQIVQALAAITQALAQLQAGAAQGAQMAMAPKTKQATAKKLPDGTWQLSSVETVQ